MYVQESLVREQHRQRLRQAESARPARQAAELRKLRKRQLRAERELLRAWQRVERVRSLLGAS